MDPIRRDTLIAKHIDAVSALIRPSRVMAIVAVNDDGRPYMIAPEANEPAVAAFLSTYTRLGKVLPEST